VLCVDNYLTGSFENVRHLIPYKNFEWLKANVAEEEDFGSGDLGDEIDFVFNLASPASPKDYQQHPVETLEAGSIGTMNLLDIAFAYNAAFVQASTSEVYGDPLVHPQPETYWGNVNSFGPRASYDEAKRFGEAATYAYAKKYGLKVRVARIFNTYGPRMRRDDGRAVPEFIRQGLAGEPMTIHGDGSQTRSLCYVDDLIAGLIRLSRSGYSHPVNLGNPREISIGDLAFTVNQLTGYKSVPEFVDRPVDDPSKRCPDIRVAERELGWRPVVDLRTGLRKTIEWMEENES
jgi:dTDP-glucose 4,6-dehydratase